MYWVEMKKRYLLLSLAVGLLGGLVIFYMWASKATVHQWAVTEADTLGAVTPPQRDTFGLITYNIGYLSGMANNTAASAADSGSYAKHLVQAANALAQADADWVLLQEIDFDAERSYRVHQARQLAAALRLPYTAHAVNWDKRFVPFPYWPPGSQFGRMLSGQSILSRYPLAEHQREALPMPAANYFWYNAFYIDRLIQTAAVRLPDQRLLYLLNVHLEAFDPETRAIQTRILADRTRALIKAGQLVIVAGDFNSTADCQADETLAHLRAVEGLTIGTGCAAQWHTYPADGPSEGIDHILVGPGIRLIGTKVLHQAGTASDHLPLYAQLVIEQAR